MDYDWLKIVGAVAGIGGIALGSVVLIFREIIRKEIFPTLTKEQSYTLLNKIVVLTFVTGILGITAYLVVSLFAPRSDPRLPNSSAEKTPVLNNINVQPNDNKQQDNSQNLAVNVNSKKSLPALPTPIKMKNNNTSISTDTSETFPSVSFPVRKFIETKVCIKQGTRLLIKAEGSLILGESVGASNADGKDSFPVVGIQVPIDKKYYQERAFPLGALMCKMSSEKKWEICGLSKIFVASDAGCLQFEVNDLIKTDNSGAYTVSIQMLQ